MSDERCEVCQSRQNLDDHHVSYDPEVTVPVCRRCHSRLHQDDDFHPELTPDRLPTDMDVADDKGEDIVRIADGEEGIYEVLNEDRQYRVEGVGTYGTERRARVAAHLMARYGVCPSIHEETAKESVAPSVAVRGNEALTAWFYVAHEQTENGSNYHAPAEVLGVTKNTARNYLSRFLRE